MQDPHPEQLTLGHPPPCKDFSVWRQTQDPFCPTLEHPTMGVGL